MGLQIKINSLLIITLIIMKKSLIVPACRCFVNAHLLLITDISLVLYHVNII